MFGEPEDHWHKCHSVIFCREKVIVHARPTRLNQQHRSSSPNAQFEYSVNQQYFDAFLILFSIRAH